MSANLKLLWDIRISLKSFQSVVFQENFPPNPSHSLKLNESDKYYVTVGSCLLTTQQELLLIYWHKHELGKPPTILAFLKADGLLNYCSSHPSLPTMRKEHVTSNSVIIREFLRIVEIFKRKEFSFRWSYIQNSSALKSNVTYSYFLIILCIIPEGRKGLKMA